MQVHSEISDGGGNAYDDQMSSVRPELDDTGILGFRFPTGRTGWKIFLCNTRDRVVLATKHFLFFALSSKIRKFFKNQDHHQL